MKNSIKNYVKIFLIIAFGILIIPFNINAQDLYTVTFNTNGGSEFETQTILPGEKLNTPPDPIKEGYRLVAWYSDEELTVVYDFTEPVNEDITLYAKWEEVSEEKDNFLDLPIPDIEIYTFDTSNRAIPIGEEETIIFTAEIFLEIVLDYNEVVLYKNNEPFAVMNDRGIDGDEKASDGFYTYQVVMKSTEEKEEAYQVKVRDQSSEIINIAFYKPLTDQELADMETVDKEIQEILLNKEFNNLTAEEKNKQLEDKINELATRNLIIKESIHVDKEEKTISFQYKCGVLGATSYKEYNSELNSGSTSNDKENSKIYIILVAIIAITIIVIVSTIIIIKRNKRKKEIQNDVV